MKKAIQAAVIASLFTSVAAFAHHPAEAIIDADTWAMIDQNLQDADSPHLDLALDNMGSASGTGSASGSGGGSGRGAGGGAGSGNGGGRR
jgi:uncharacterized membrane protein YgcG